jgi:hypothetical protein
MGAGGWPIEMIRKPIPSRPVGRWLNLEFDGREVRFFAALSEVSPNPMEAMPFSLRFVLACRRRGVRASGKMVEYHRFESGLAARVTEAQRSVYFLHNHPVEAPPTTISGEVSPGIHQDLRGR